MLDLCSAHCSEDKPIAILRDCNNFIPPQNKFLATPLEKECMTENKRNCYVLTTELVLEAQALTER